MAHIKYKEVTKHFNFTKALKLEDAPGYTKVYTYDDEILLGVYKVDRDHGLITNKKLILFDNSTSIRPKKQITTIPYYSISSHTIMFYESSAEIYLLLNSGNPILLKFSNMSDVDKARLRFLYNAMSAAICKQEIPSYIIQKLINDDFKFKK